jgi:hypothetical protein
MTRSEYALAYAALGLHVLPIWWLRGDGSCACGKADCVSPGKHPIHKLVPRGHHDATTEPARLQAWFTAFPDANVGISLAPSYLAALDVDPRNGGDATYEMLEAKHGPITSTWHQRTGGGGDHYVFACPPGVVFPGKFGAGVDGKHRGYVLVEPSTTDGAYQWLDGGPLEGEAPSELPAWLLSQATQPRVVHAPAVAGDAPGFEWMGETGRAELTSAMEACPNVERDDWLRMGMVLHMLDPSPQGLGYALWEWWSQLGEGARKFDAKDQARVWLSFRRHKDSSLHRESIFWWARKNGWRGRAVITEFPAEEPIEPDGETGTGCDPELLSIPVGILQTLVDYMEFFSEEPQRQISIQAALATACTVSGRLYISENNNPSNCYFLTLAGTGVGKNYVKTAITRLMCDAGAEKLVSGSGNTSAGAVFSALFQSPTHIQIMDEFGKHLAMARAQQNGAMLDAFAVLTEAYSDAAGILRPRNYSTFHLDKARRSVMDPKFVRKPSITILGFSAPEQVFEKLTSAEIDDGFLNRFIAVQATLPPEQERPLRLVETPECLTEWVRQCRKMNLTQHLYSGESAYDEEPGQSVVSITEEAKAVFSAFKAEIRDAEARGEYQEPKLVRRWRENAMRLATALAVAECPAEPSISGIVADWCVRYVRHYGMEFMRSVAYKVADSDHHRLYKEIVRLIRKAGPRGMTERELAKASRLFEKTPPVHRDAALNALCRDELAQYTTFKPRSGRGKDRQAYVAIIADNADTTPTEVSASISHGWQGFGH